MFVFVTKFVAWTLVCLCTLAVAVLSHRVLSECKLSCIVRSPFPFHCLQATPCCYVVGRKSFYLSSGYRIKASKHMAKNRFNSCFFFSFFLAAIWVSQCFEVFSKLVLCSTTWCGSSRRPSVMFTCTVLVLLPESEPPAWPTAPWSMYFNACVVKGRRWWCILWAAKSIRMHRVSSVALWVKFCDGEGQIRVMKSLAVFFFFYVVFNTWTITFLGSFVALCSV